MAARRSEGGYDIATLAQRALDYLAENPPRRREAGALKFADWIPAPATGGETYFDEEEPAPQLGCLLSRPFCDRCGVSVDSFEEQLDDHMRRVRFIARCHGEEEHIDVPLEHAKGRVSFGRAFVR